MNFALIWSFHQSRGFYFFTSTRNVSMSEIFYFETAVYVYDVTKYTRFKHIPCGEVSDPVVLFYFSVHVFFTRFSIFCRFHVPRS